jgi:hypothetical protein
MKPLRAIFRFKSASVYMFGLINLLDLCDIGPYLHNAHKHAGLTTLRKGGRGCCSLVFLPICIYIHIYLNIYIYIYMYTQIGEGCRRPPIGVFRRWARCLVARGSHQDNPCGRTFSVHGENPASP